MYKLRYPLFAHMEMLVNQFCLFWKHTCVELNYKWPYGRLFDELQAEKEEKKN